MKIVIDTSSLIGEITGVGKYTYNLIKNLSLIDKKNRYILYFHQSRASRYRKKVEELLKEVLNYNFKLWMRYRFLPKNLKIYRKFFNKVDIFHGTGFYLPPLFDKDCSVITVHDLTFEVYPHFWEKKSWIRGRKNAISSAKKANLIIAVSENTKKDIIKYWGISEEKIVVIYEGIDERFKRDIKEEEIIKFKQKYSLPPEYILFVGTLAPHKNLTFLLKSFERFLTNGSKYSLVICGKRGWCFEDIFNTINNLKCKDRIKYIGYLPDDEMYYLYSGASLFVFPSLYEGFGLPPLEAMACGVPVITSNVSSLPEVVGDAALLIDPTNMESLAKAMYEVLNNDLLREKLIKKGLERIRNFSWEETARKTLAVYEELTKKIN